jgi:hypothetical protein
LFHSIGENIRKPTGKKEVTATQDILKIKHNELFDNETFLIYDKKRKQ